MLYKWFVSAGYHHLRGRYKWDIAIYTGVGFGYQSYIRADILSVYTLCLPSQLLASCTQASTEVGW